MLTVKILTFKNKHLISNINNLEQYEKYCTVKLFLVNIFKTYILIPEPFIQIHYDTDNNI